MIPILPLDLLRKTGRNYHLDLEINQQALNDRTERVVTDLGLGKCAFPKRPKCEVRRIEIADELRAMNATDQEAFQRVPEPVGPWHVLAVPDVVQRINPSDPTALWNSDSSTPSPSSSDQSSPFAFTRKRSNSSAGRA